MRDIKVNQPNHEAEIRTEVPTLSSSVDSPRYDERAETVSKLSQPLLVEESDPRKAVVYVASCDPSFYKIGVSLNVRSRLAQLRGGSVITPASAKLETLRGFLIKEGSYDLENTVHRALRRYHVAGTQEWFFASPTSTEILKQMGFTPYTGANPWDRTCEHCGYHFSDEEIIRHAAVINGRKGKGGARKGAGRPKKDTK